MTVLLLIFQDYIIPNNRHATLFYHDHSVGITSENVYAGTGPQPASAEGRCPKIGMLPCADVHASADVCLQAWLACALCGPV